MEEPNISTGRIVLIAALNGVRLKGLLITSGPFLFQNAQTLFQTNQRNKHMLQKWLRYVRKCDFCRTNHHGYGLYSAGISDAQKREIVDGVRLPVGST